MFTQDNNYPYLEELTEGILRHFPAAPPDRRPVVLDVGCGQGTLGQAIADLGYEVWGIEQDSFAASRARSRVAKVVEADLTDGQAIEAALSGQRFDRIVFSDVLEHVPDPLGVLRVYLDSLEPDGRVLISLPNVANWQTRLALLFGRFRYEDSGVLDRTHLRFFTFATATEMVRRADLEVETVDHTPFVARAALPVAKRFLAGRSTPTPVQDDARAIIDSRPFRLYMRWIYPIEYRLTAVRRSLFAFRIIIVAKRTA